MRWWIASRRDGSSRWESRAEALRRLKPCFTRHEYRHSTVGPAFSRPLAGGGLQPDCISSRKFFVAAALASVLEIREAEWIADGSSAEHGNQAGAVGSGGPAFVCGSRGGSESHG